MGGTVNIVNILTGIFVLSTFLVVSGSGAGVPCLSVNNQPGKCVSFDLCPPFLRMLKAPQISPNDIRLLQRLTCEYDNPKVCCPYNEVVESVTVQPNHNPQFQSNLKHSSLPQQKPQVQEHVPSSAPSVTLAATNWNNFDIDEDEETKVNERIKSPGPENPSYRNHPNFNYLPTFEDCGNVGSTDNIVGGRDAMHGGHPWMVRIGYRNTETNEIEFYCSGTVISRRYILTAAHCSEEIDPEYIPEIIRVGEHNTTTDRDCSEYGCSEAQDYLIEEISAHPAYSPDDKFNDIGLIRVSTDIDFSTRYVRPICLAFKNEYNVARVFPSNFNGRKGLVAGWGRTKWNRAEGSTTLQEVFLPMLSNEECQSKYSTRAKITDKQMCAGGIRGKDSCGGDSGGPFILPINTGRSGLKFFQLGVVSFGPVQCGVGGDSKLSQGKYIQSNFFLPPAGQFNTELRSSINVFYSRIRLVLCDQ
ncbi:unnamed protein product [Allacma fusca]|uniref:CLIP domain-containing serine protease n=1 Tax=Allacma fusca TaxID=39272 RepID=A0A8J2JVR6_9HEXA|nr:unnamed protein product [Allacma fusca]